MCNTSSKQIYDNNLQINLTTSTKHIALLKNQPRGQKRIDWQTKRIKRDEKERRALEDKFDALKDAVLEVVDDKEMFMINNRFDINLGNRMGLPLLSRPFQSVLKANETNELCIPSKTNEEPLEVIDLDEVYKMKQIDTNGF